MKIEKLNENQIRCTLTPEDLADRQLRLGELAYGTEKTQNLFREMLREADCEYGFEAEDSPLMIEAIPLRSGSITLIITKVDDPEELDTRFSHFAPSFGEYASDPEDPDYEEDLLDPDSFAPARPAKPVPSFQEVLQAATDDEARESIFLFTMRSLSDVMKVAALLSPFAGESALYKDNASDRYLLALQRGDEAADTFRRHCRIASEFGQGKCVPAAGRQFLSEHMDVMIAQDAIGKLK
ncbi:MAG: adaptor protein MecA [Lachnospiraceae bacterium]|nr:adaptor protein MecA [Lachnospiraceae bacterium]